MNQNRILICHILITHTTKIWNAAKISFNFNKTEFQEHEFLIFALQTVITTIKELNINGT